jgi:ParB family protein of integrating conjugative element (PFGI_1 class)
VSRIKSYEHNPRRVENIVYDRIKSSISRDGLAQPLVVTQRPGETDFVVHAGGNTRLRILKELFAETGDSRFGTVACIVRGWSRETDVLLAHLKENDLRGELVFVDKALATMNAKHLLEQEEGMGELSQTHLAETLAERGYSLSQGLISQMVYTVERLQPLLPQALKGGMGRPQVARIRALDRVARAFWLERSVDTETQFDEAFSVLCQRHDGPDWDLANLRRSIEAEIAERAEISIHAVSIELDARLAGRSVLPAEGVSGAQSNDTEDGELKSTPAISDADPDPATAPREAPELSSGADALSSRAPPRVPDTDFSEPGANSGPIPDDDDDVSTGSVVTLGTPAPTDMKSLRARLWTLASRLAQRNGLADLVEPLPGKGLGFMLRDVPDPALVDQLDEDALAQVSMVWWHLAACAEMTVAPLEALLPALPEESVLRRALAEQDAGLLFASVWTLDPGHMGYRLWQRLDERDWQDLLGLMAAYRKLHHVASTENRALWGDTS